MAKRDISIEQFCNNHRACFEGRKWALANCETMQDVWKTATGNDLQWVAGRPRVLSYEDVVKFAVYCARRVAYGHYAAAVNKVELHFSSLGRVSPLPEIDFMVPRSQRRWYVWHAVTQLIKGARLHNTSTLMTVPYYSVCAVQQSRRASERRVQTVWLRKNTTPDFSLKTHEGNIAPYPL